MFTRRRVVGLSLVAAAFVWMSVAGYLEARRIDAQRGARPVTSARNRRRCASTAIGLMSTVQTLDRVTFRRPTDRHAWRHRRARWIQERMKAAGLLSVSGAYHLPVPFHASVDQRDRGSRSLVQDRVHRRRQRRRPVSSARITKAPVMLVTAHYDHLGIRGGAMYPALTTTRRASPCCSRSPSTAVARRSSER